MKNAIIMVSILCASIIFVVLLLSSARNSPEKDYNSNYSSPVNDVDFELVIVTSEKNFWERVAALKATEAPEFIAVTDEDISDKVGNWLIHKVDEQKIKKLFTYQKNCDII